MNIAKARKVARRAAPLVSFLLAAGCGGGGESIDTGLNGSLSLSELSSAQVESACTEIGQQSTNIVVNAFDKDLACRLAGLGGDTREECNEIVSLCKKNISQSDIDALLEEEDFVEGDDLACDASDLGDLSGCSATVSDFEACYNSLIKLVLDAFNGFSCDDIGSDEESFDAFVDALDVEGTAECTALESACAGSSIDLSVARPMNGQSTLKSIASAVAAKSYR